MMRVMLAFVYWIWWRFVLFAAKPGHPAYLHAQWRMWQERERMRSFLRG